MDMNLISDLYMTILRCKHQLIEDDIIVPENIPSTLTEIVVTENDKHLPSGETNDFNVVSIQVPEPIIWDKSYSYGGENL